MESEVDQASEDHAILGKRKRDSDLQDAINAPLAASIHLVDRIPSSLQVSDSKRQRRPTASSRGHSLDRKPNQHPRSTTLTTLPVELLQHICSFLDPFTLGRLICVNTQFRALLDPREPRPTASGRCKNLVPLPQNSIWSRSRQFFLPAIPHPLHSLSEPEMLQLVLGSRCQFCGRLPSKRTSVAARSQWNAGPGPEGVRTIWPFKVRSCADCLRARLVREQELILLPSSVLRPGLPFACFTPSLNYIATISLQQGSLPAGLQLTKYYFRPQIEELQTQMQQIQSLAPTAYAQWYRGLEPVLEDFTSDVLRLEKWDLLHHTVEQQEMMFPDGSSVSSYSGRSGPYGSSYTQSNYTSTNPSTWQYRGGSRKHTVHRQSFGSNSFPTTVKGSIEDENNAMLPAALGTSLTSANRITASPATYRGSERSIQDVLRAKSQRRADIEYQCRMLEPPLVESDLLKLKSFNAAIQIAKPLDKTAWELLKPRILAERQALQDDRQVDANETSSYHPSRETVISKDDNDVRDRSPDVMQQAQRSTREKVAEIAQEFIKRCYMSGTNVTADTAPRFAADVLDHVAVRFYEIQQREDAELALQGQPPLGDSESGMRTRRLQLRHMRHVVDNCILPYTELVQKDLFLCSGCEPSEKYFPFLGLIQHYAAKHTDNFSRGSQTVHWASAWPLKPPFRNPSSLSAANAELVNMPGTSSYQQDRMYDQSSDSTSSGGPLQRDNRFRVLISPGPELAPSSVAENTLVTQPMLVHDHASESSTVHPSADARPRYNQDDGHSIGTLRQHTQTTSNARPEAVSTYPNSAVRRTSSQAHSERTSILRMQDEQTVGFRPHSMTGAMHASREVDLVHPQPIQVHPLVRRQTSASSYAARGLAYSRSPASDIVPDQSSKQVDDFLRGFDIGSHDVNTSETEFKPFIGSKSTPRPRDDSHGNRTIEERSHHSPYTNQQGYSLATSPMNTRDHKLQASPPFIEHFPTSRPYIQPSREYALQEQQYYRREEYPHRGHRFGSGSRQLSNHQHDLRYAVGEARTTGFTRSNVDYRASVPPQSTHPVTQTRVQYADSRNPAVYYEQEVPPASSQYGRAAHDRRHYVLARSYVPVVEDHDVDRRYQRQPVYYENDYHAQQSSPRGTHQAEDQRWSHHR